MSDVDLKVNEKPWQFLQAAKDKAHIFLFGGASSSKSWTLAQFLIVEKLLKEKNIGVHVFRKTVPDVKRSCYRLMCGLLHKLGLRHGKHFTQNKTDRIIRFRGGNFIQFDGLDDVLKLKSLEGINYIWLEETTEFTKREFLQVDLRNRAENVNGRNQVYCSFNPVDPIGNQWLKDKADDQTNPNSVTMMLTHTDNPFLSQDEHDKIEALADQDEEYNKIYRLGQWATPTNLIYNNWDVVLEMPERYDERVWGLDFGYSANPAALVELWFVGDELYERERLYRTGLTNPELIQHLKDIIGQDNRFDMIVADCAEPKSIQEIKNAGFNIHPCQKGPDSVRNGINTVRAQKIHICADSTSLIDEKRGYKWKVDKDDNVLPEPVKFRDHLMDAERYAIQKIKGKVKAGFKVVEIGDEEAKSEQRGERYELVHFPPHKKEKTDEKPELDPIFDDDLWG